MTLRIDQDDSRDAVAIEGVTYSQEVFRQLSHFLPIGQPFEIMARADGVLTIRRLPHRVPHWPEVASEHPPSPATLRQLVAEYPGRVSAVQAAGGKPQPINFTTANLHAPHHPGTCRGPDVCPHDWKAPGALPAPCRVCGGRDPLPF